MSEEVGTLIASNGHLLEKILNYCGTKALLQCRMVCKLWAEETARILRRKGCLIAFRSMEDIEEFIFQPRPTSTTFTHFLVDIPSCHILNSDEKDFEMPNSIISLLDLCNEEMQELKFWYTPLLQETEASQETEGENVQQTDESDFELVTFSNLKSLQLLSNYVNPSQQSAATTPVHRMPKYFSHLRLPSLSSLAVQHLHDTDCSATVISIIKSSQTPIKYLKIPAKPFANVAVDDSVLLTNLSELDLLGIFHGFSCSTDETLSCIIKCCPNLKKLGIAFSFRTTPIKIQELWTTLAKTLEELKCTIQDRNLLARQIVRTDFTFPHMMALKSLQMRWSNPGLIYYIDHLPFLKELMLDTVWTRKIQGNLFPNGQDFIDGISAYEQLVSLKMTEIVNVGQIKAFARYFPNLQILGCSFESNETLRSVYENMRTLKWLIIERRSNVTESEGLCGVEENEWREYAEKFHGQLKSGENIPPPNFERKFSSIDDLKGLETLELCQLGVSWQSIVFGVVELAHLKSLVIQSKAFKDLSTMVDQNFLQLIASRLNKLQKLTLWIRHSCDRPSSTEIQGIEYEMPFLNEINIINHSLCGI